jgi:hypothetical protein
MVMDTNGCTDEATLFLDVAKEFEVYIPNVFTQMRWAQMICLQFMAITEIKEIVKAGNIRSMGNLIYINENIPT